MAAGYGMSGAIGIAKESTWGTPVGATDYMEAMSENLALSLDRFPTRNLVAGMYEPDDAAGLVRIGGGLSVAANPIPMGYFLNGVLGSSSATTVLSGFLYTNVFQALTADTAANNPVPSYTFEVFRDVTSSQQYAGCLFSQVKFSLAPNGPLMMGASLIGKAMLNIAKTVAVFPGSPTQPFTYDTASLQIAGAASSIVEAFDLTIDNQLQGVATLSNTSTITKVKRNGPQTVRLGATLSFEDITQMNNFLNQTEFAFKASMTKANSFAMLFDVPRVVYTAYPTGINGRGRQTVSVTGMGRWLSTSASAILISLTNTKASY